jgi:hypothetical protein
MTAGATGSLPRDVDDALAAPVSLALGEADVLLVAERLVGRVRPDRFRVPPSSSSTPSPSLRLAVARTFAVGSLAWLHAAGGHAPRTVLRRPLDVGDAGVRDVVSPLRGGVVRCTGRLEDAALNVGEGALDLRCSTAPLAFVWDLCVDVLPSASSSSSSSSSSSRAAIPQPAPAATTGDHVFCALAHEHLGGLDLDGAQQESLARGLRRASALAALWRPEDAAHPLAVDDVATVVSPGLVRVLECVEPALSRTWRRAVAQTWSVEDAAAMEARWRALASSAAAFLRALDAAGRLDLCGPVVAVVSAWAQEAPSDPRPRLLRVPGVATMADRDRLIAAVVAVADLAAAVEDVRGRLLACRFGDDRFDEARVALPLLEQHWLPVRPVVEAFVHRLTGRVG